MSEELELSLFKGQFSSYRNIAFDVMMGSFLFVISIFTPFTGMEFSLFTIYLFRRFRESLKSSVYISCVLIFVFELFMFPNIYAFYMVGLDIVCRIFMIKSIEYFDYKFETKNIFMMLFLANLLRIMGVFIIPDFYHMFVDLCQGMMSVFPNVSDSFLALNPHSMIFLVACIQAVQNGVIITIFFIKTKRILDKIVNSIPFS